MKKTILRCFLILFALLLPVSALAGIGFLTPPQYDKTFLGALSPKVERLYSIEEPKVIIIGGSSVAFGYDTKLMEQHLGMPVVNFGLYASLGTKVMLDMAKDAIRKGDIVVLAPEMDAQTLSLYFNGEALWQAADSDFSLLAKVHSDNRNAMIGNFWGYTAGKFHYLRTGAPDPEGVYRADSFDEYGDLIYSRPQNEMALAYDPTTIISLTPSILDAEFATYLNEYIGDAEKKGATVYFTFSPMNELAMAGDTTDQSLLDFYAYLTRTLDCEIISSLKDCIMEAGYFYDSNFHLNDSGVIVRTATLIKDIRRAQGITTPVNIILPEAPALPERPEDVDKIDPNDAEASKDADCFTYEVREADGKLIVTGVTEAGKSRTELTVPAYYEGQEVVAIGEYAFRDCTKLETLIVQKNVTAFYNKAFAGCDSLKKVRLNTEGKDPTVNPDGLMEETSSALRFSIASEYYANFVTQYNWIPYKSFVVAED